MPAALMVFIFEIVQRSLTAKDSLDEGVKVSSKSREDIVGAERSR